MFQKSLKLSIVVMVIVSYVTLLFGTGYAAPPTVKLIVNPNKTDVYVGSDPVALTAKATGSGLKFKWELQGPGKIEGTGSAIFYNIPDKIEGKSAQAIVTVTVTDEAGQETTETFTFNILPEKKEAAPEPAKEGMSKTTKIALGAGAAAALGLGVALAAGGGGDGDNEPFTGSFRGEDHSDLSNRGNPYTYYYVFNLSQNGTVLTGSLVNNSTLIDCCTNVVTVPVTGNVDGNSANLSWGAGEASCECSWTTWHSDIDANSGHVTLFDNGRIFHFDEGAEYTRISKMGQAKINNGVEEKGTVCIEGDFVRQ